MSGSNPWERNAGLFDSPSSAVPKPAKKKRAKAPKPERTLEVDVAPAGALLDPVGAEAAAEPPPAVVVEPETAKRADHAAELLKSFVDRVLRLREERRGLNADIKEVLGEAKGTGFNVEALKTVVLRLEKPEKDWDTLDATIAIYRDVVGTGGAGLDPIMDAARDPGLLAHAASAAEGAPPASTKKPTAKERQLREAIGWIQGTRH
jgi:uncharacterized protein (UPF0335 family)